MKHLTDKLLGRTLRKQRVRAKVTGSEARPRLTVTISNMHITAQIIDDTKQTTLAAASTVGNKLAKGTMTEKAAIVGADLAKKALKKNVKQVVFDRNGRQYAGRLKALADAARKEVLIWLLLNHRINKIAVHSVAMIASMQTVHHVKKSSLKKLSSVSTVSHV